jgi:hypothetical protein
MGRRRTQTGASLIVKTFMSSKKYDHRTKLPVGLVKKFPAQYGDRLYFQKENDSVVVSKHIHQRENLLFGISVDVENRARLTEANLKRLGAKFGDDLEFIFIDKGKAAVKVHRQKSGNSERPNFSPTLKEESSKTDVYWSDVEVRETVESYFLMLTGELQGRAYNKTEFRNGLLTRIKRTIGAVEYKYQNISAALIAKGLPYIEGYKPASNYQRALDDAVDNYLEAHPEFLQLVTREVEDIAVDRPMAHFTNVLVDPPEQVDKKDKAERKRSYQARKYDFSKRDNEKLGKLGEEFVVGYERQRFLDAGRPDLADKVERISETRGDGAGYDVLSFEEDGTDRFIEVKTTNSGKECPFYISANELDFSQDFSEKYYLYRVFNFKKSPKLFMLRGSLKERFEITPAVFRVSF